MGGGRDRLWHCVLPMQCCKHLRVGNGRRKACRHTQWVQPQSRKAPVEKALKWRAALTSPMGGGGHAEHWLLSGSLGFDLI